MSDVADLQAKILRGIPMSDAMGYCITHLDATAITVEAPLAPNVNVHGTGFAGSLYALGILTAWALSAHLIARAGLDAELVVAAATIRYRRPVREDIRCRCAVDVDAAHAFTEHLAGAGRARLALEVRVGDGPAAVIEAQMHARLAEPPP
ncbi:MAG: YiiD C-terminal domain-containing protein [Chromatiaceae bacterium]|nr:YiiD C-terminal domain-containing protein [Chromatiaceae bacterium]MCP5315010.1 YiiD C-terminal domain-containing protein [Chromatiaceae bacterium]